MLADMSILLDSDVLVAGVLERHPHHARAKPWLQRAAAGEVDAVVAAHSLAQVYRVLTTYAIGPRIAPGDAADMIERDIVARCRVRAIDSRGHLKCIRALSRRGIAGGAVYDGLIAEVGRAARVDKIVTFNVADFRRVAPDMDVVAP